VGVLDVVLEASIQPVVEEAIIESDVGLCRLLPLQIRVRVSERCNASDGIVAERIARATAGAEQDERRVSRHRRIPLLAPPRAQSQLAQSADLREERLLAKAPRARDGREGRPLVVLTEL